ncbi:MAG TPA: hypothetical protein PLT63_05995 [Syntrophales bacterium]|nr:hypothetical protein [Syntrophales bacterium]
MLHPNIRPISTPNLVRVVYGQILQQVRVTATIRKYPWQLLQQLLTPLPYLVRMYAKFTG